MRQVTKERLIELRDRMRLGTNRLGIGDHLVPKEVQRTGEDLASALDELLSKRDAEEEALYGEPVFQFVEDEKKDGEVR